jgi:hypothetical protein
VKEVVIQELADENGEKVQNLVHLGRCFNITQAYCVEISKHLCEAVHRIRPELWPSDWIIYHDSTPTHKVLSVEQFLAQEWIIEVEHPLYSPDLTPKDVWLFPEIKSALKGTHISGY